MARTPFRTIARVDMHPALTRADIEDGAAA